MAKTKIFNYLAASFIAFLLILWYYQNKNGGGEGLLPGEYIDKSYPSPVVASVKDSDCSDSVSCPSKIRDCIRRTFSVERDSVYFLTVGYFNGDTLHATCQACGTLFKGDSVVMNRFTACPAGGPLIDSARLKPGIDYTLVVCLQNCQGHASCECGKNAVANAAVSFKRMQ